MVIPGDNPFPFLDTVSVSYELINFNTLQPVSHSGNYAQVNNNRFISLRVKPMLSSFDKRVNKILLTFKQYTSLSYEVSLSLSNSAHLISSYTIPLRVYASNGITCYEADITDLISSDPTKEIYLAITAASSMSFYVNGLNCPSASIITYSVNTGLYSPYYDSRLKTFSLRNYRLDVDLFSLNTFDSFDLFHYENELLSFNLSLVHSFTNRNTSNITETIVTGFPNGFKLNVQQYIYQSGTRTYNYIDENFFTHVFTIFTNDDGTFTYYYDENGSYLLLEILANGYKIYDLNGNVKIFNSNGYITSQTIINGNNQSTINFSYTNNLLTSISINNDISISINYSNNPIVISLPTQSGSSSISIEYDVDNYLVSITDQENATYSIYYLSEDDGLINEVIVDGEIGVSLSFNDQLMIEEVSYYKYDDFEPDECDSTYCFWSNTYSTKYTEDYDLIYSYNFTSDGEIKLVYSYDENNDAVLSADAIFKNNQAFRCLSTNKPDYLGNIQYKLNGVDYYYNSFENSVSFSYAIRFLNFTLTPKGLGRYFLYFEYGRNHITNYQTLNALSLSISVGDNILQTYSIVQNEPLDTNGFDHVNVFMKEIVIPESFAGQKVKLAFKLTSGETDIFLQNIRLYYFDNNNDEYYGVNFNTGYDDQELESENERFYGLPDAMTLRKDNLTYSFSTSYFDILASLMYRFYLNKNVAFYNNGKNACLGVFSYNYNSLDTIKISKTCYCVGKNQDGDYYFNGYITTISSFDNNHFIERTAQYEKDSHAICFSEEQINTSHLVESKLTSIPDGVNGSSFHKFQLLQSNSYNNYGLLTDSIITAYGDSLVTPNFVKAGSHRTYSSNNKYLASINQKLYLNNQQQNDISVSYQFNSVGDLSSKTDAYNKTTAYEFNKFHLLKKLESYNLSAYHINTVTYDKNLNASSMKDSINQGQIDFVYASDGEITSVSYDNLEVTFSKNQNNRTITYSEGNQSYSLTNEYSYFDLPTSTKVNNNTILSYHYTNKHDCSSGYGNPYLEQLTSIYDYKDSSNTKIRYYQYNVYGNVDKIIENGVELDIGSYKYPQQNENDCGFADNAIKTSLVYKKNSSVIRIENNYYLYSDPDYKFKTIHDGSSSLYAAVFSSRINSSNGRSEITVQTVGENTNLLHKSINSYFDFYTDENGKFTSYPSKQTISVLSKGTYYIDYSYNNNGNLSGISSTDFSTNISYTYDMFNQISSESSTDFGQIDYEYDSRGNIVGKTIYSTSTVYSYYYDSYNRLTHFVKTVGLNNSETFYCSNYLFGRPWTYKGKTLQWDRNELVQYDNVYFTYDGYGRRIKKVTPDREINYLYIDNLLLEETITENNNTYILRYLYDTDNNPIGFIYNATVYFYVKDSLNNVIAIYDQNNNQICRYVYTAYGNHNIVWSTESNHQIALLNPFRFRSYYFDRETNLYYLKSRYYDPETCRFISMDDLAFLNPNKINGVNLYCYCLNNPVMYSDVNGCSAEWWEWAQGIGRIITGAIALVAGVLVIASGIAGASMLVIASITILAGALTVNNGVADTIGNATGYNYMSDGLFQGNSNAYGWYSGITEGVAVIGSAICGGWLRYNGPRISAYKGIGNYNYSVVNSDFVHMTRPWQNSIITQRNVIRYGKMVRDGTGWAFEAAGYFNNKSKLWRLVVDISRSIIWHWGPF